MVAPILKTCARERFRDKLVMANSGSTGRIPRFPGTSRIPTIAAASPFSQSRETGRPTITGFWLAEGE